MGLFKWLFGEVEIEREHFEETEEYKKLQEEDKKLGVWMKRNERAYELEQAKEFNKAIKLYRKNIDMNYDGVRPFNRLAIIYRKLKDIDSEISILKEGIKVFSSFNDDPEYRDMTKEIDMLNKRLQKAIAIKNKN
jgi:tetratricopeptide (TPR) repeat protein